MGVLRTPGWEGDRRTEQGATPGSFSAARWQNQGRGFPEDLRQKTRPVLFFSVTHWPNLFSLRFLRTGGFCVVLEEVVLWTFHKTPSPKCTCIAAVRVSKRFSQLRNNLLRKTGWQSGFSWRNFKGSTDFHYIIEAPFTSCNQYALGVPSKSNARKCSPLCMHQGSQPCLSFLC